MRITLGSSRAAKVEAVRAAAARVASIDTRWCDSTFDKAELITLLKGWAYGTNGSLESFGASPSIVVPHAMVKSVVDDRRELAEVIDETAGEHDVRSRQGAWGSCHATYSRAR